MSQRGRENSETERLLGKTRLAEPSHQLKERITEAARSVWRQTQEDVHWVIPLKRLSVSAAAAVLIISSANYISELAVTQRRPGVGKTRRELPDLDTLPEAPYEALVKYYVMAIHKPSRDDTSVLREYRERMQELLDEAQQQGASNPSGSIDGRSRALPARPRFASYSGTQKKGEHKCVRES